MQKMNIMNKNNAIVKYFENINNDKSYKKEIITFILFCVGVIFLSFFHEPWFDEFQSWGISKDSLYNILFVIPHTEGHPPLWYLILKCFTSFNINPELAIKIPNLTIMICAVGLLIFKSPFPKIVRLTLPFTYFIFYQYSITSRTYCLFILAIFLSAMFYKTKDEHPFKFISCLGFLCLTSAFGMLYATAITLVWVIEIWNKQNVWKFLKDFIKDKRFHAMLCLFVLCCVISAEIYPIKDNTAVDFLSNTPTFLKSIYVLFGLVSDTTIFNVITPYNMKSYNFYKEIPVLSICCFIFGLLLNVYLIQLFYKMKKLMTFLLPYSFMLLFAFFIHFHPHHSGLLMIILITTFWITYSNFSLVSTKNKIVLCVITTLILITQIQWSSCAYIEEIIYDYVPGRQISEFIKRHHFDNNYKIMIPWLEEKVIMDNEGNKYDDISKLDPKKQYTEYRAGNTNCFFNAVIINPYFNRNIFYNFNVDYPDKLYNIQKLNTKEDNRITKEKWRKLGIPDLLIGEMAIQTVWGDQFQIPYYYIPIKQLNTGFIWKNSIYYGNVIIYIHKKLWDPKFNEIEAINPKDAKETFSKKYKKEATISF